MMELGNVAIQTVSGLTIDQQYEQFGGETILRMISGRGVKQQTYNKLRVTTRGTGWAPSGLESLDYSTQMVLKCIVPRSIPAVLATRQATLPAGRRSDDKYLPFAHAFLSDGSRVLAAVTLVGHVATCAAVAGAIAYRVMYYPQLTVWALKPSESGSVADASYQWELVAEEI